MAINIPTAAIVARGMGGTGHRMSTSTSAWLSAEHGTHPPWPSSLVAQCPCLWPEGGSRPPAWAGGGSGPPAWHEGRY
eukprot:12485548-Alexandrium_andersonii.AAC.1